MTIQNASLWVQTMWAPSRCRPSVCLCATKLWCWWVKTPWCAKPFVATWRTILPWRSEFTLLNFCYLERSVFILQDKLQCSLVGAALSFPLRTITCFQLSLSVYIPRQPGTQGHRHLTICPRCNDVNLLAYLIACPVFWQASAPHKRKCGLCLHQGGSGRDQGYAAGQQGKSWEIWLWGKDVWHRCNI